jgi:hypothetical protein
LIHAIDHGLLKHIPPETLARDVAKWCEPEI